MSNEVSVTKSIIYAFIPKNIQSAIMVIEIMYFCEELYCVNTLFILINIFFIFFIIKFYQFD